MPDCSLTYRIDSDDRISFLDARWDECASVAGRSAMTAANLIGRPFADFITGVEAKHVSDLLVRRARAGATVTVPFRCDAPDRRRYMSMTITGLSDRSVEFHTRLMREECREPQALIDGGIARSDSLVTVCSWCKKVKLDEAWVEIEDAVGRLQLFDVAALPRITHGMCAACFESLATTW